MNIKKIDTTADPTIYNDHPITICDEKQEVYVFVHESSIMKNSHEQNCSNIILPCSLNKQIPAVLLAKDDQIFDSSISNIKCVTIKLDDEHSQTNKKWINFIDEDEHKQIISKYAKSSPSKSVESSKAVEPPKPTKQSKELPKSTEPLASDIVRSQHSKFSRDPDRSHKLAAPAPLPARPKHLYAAFLNPESASIYEASIQNQMNATEELKLTNLKHAIITYNNIAANYNDLIEFAKENHIKLDYDPTVLPSDRKKSISIRNNTSDTNDEKATYIDIKDANIFTSDNDNDTDLVDTAYENICSKTETLHTARDVLYAYIVEKCADKIDTSVIRDQLESTHVRIQTTAGRTWADDTAAFNLERGIDTKSKNGYIGRELIREKDGIKYAASYNGYALSETEMDHLEASLNDSESCNYIVMTQVADEKNNCAHNYVCHLCPVEPNVLGYTHYLQIDEEIDMLSENFTSDQYKNGKTVYGPLYNEKYAAYKSEFDMQRAKGYITPSERIDKLKREISILETDGIMSLKKNRNIENDIKNRANGKTFSSEKGTPKYIKSVYTRIDEDGKPVIVHRNATLLDKAERLMRMQAASKGMSENYGFENHYDEMKLKDRMKTSIDLINGYETAISRQQANAGKQLHEIAASVFKTTDQPNISDVFVIAQKDTAQSDIQESYKKLLRKPTEQGFNNMLSLLKQHADRADDILDRIKSDTSGEYTEKDKQLWSIYHDQIDNAVTSVSELKDRNDKNWIRTNKDGTINAVDLALSNGNIPIQSVYDRKSYCKYAELLEVAGITKNHSIIDPESPLPSDLMTLYQCAKMNDKNFKTKLNIHSQQNIEQYKAFQSSMQIRLLSQSKDVTEKRTTTCDTEMEYK